MLAILRRFAFSWPALNLAGMALYLRLASTLWPFPGEENLPGAAGDAFFWFLEIVPLLVVAIFGNVGAFVFVIRNRKRRDGLTNALVWAVVAALWLSVVIYGEERAVRPAAL